VSNPAELTRITHVITGLATGGAEMMLLKLLGHWRAREFRHDVISLRDDQSGPIHAALVSLGIRVDCLGLSWPFPRPALVKRLASWLDEREPHIVQGWEVHGNLAATLAARFWHAPGRLIWGVRGSLDRPESERYRTRLIIRVLGTLSQIPYRITYNSFASARQHEEIGYDPLKSVVIPNGFDMAAFRPDAKSRDSVRRELGLPPDVFLAGVIARYHPAKDHVNLLDAAVLLRSRLKIHFLLAGRGVDSSNRALVRLLAERQLTGQVSLLGQREDVSRLMAGLDLLVLPSCAESFPNVVGEAMASGVPCVVTRVGDAEHIVSDTGLVVPPRDAVALASAIYRFAALTTEERRALGRKAQERIRSCFSIQDICSQYVHLYRSCVLGSDPAGWLHAERLRSRTVCAES